ncbi:MAG: zinc ribbon domain-containing protein [Clostridia bacterium]|nr:zinc ribbon domain-containing protein [Clostridia bacterium]
MKCGYCGKNIRDDATFCTYCGRNLSENAPEEESVPPIKTSPTGALITLLLVLLILGAGSLRLLRESQKEPRGVVVSVSDTSHRTPVKAEESQLDKMIVGKWSCTDPAAADYDQNDYGIQVKITLVMKEDGQFQLQYKMSDTGASALKLRLDGDYLTRDGVISFRPDLSALDGETGGEFFKRHGKTPTFTYTVTEKTLTLHYDNDTDVTFRRAD